MTYLWSDHVARSGLPLRQDRHSVAIGMFDDLRARGVETDTLRQLPAATVEALRASASRASSSPRATAATRHRWPR